ncbi:MAG: lipid II flippase MurJ, partial [Bosea sp.]|nr:lipid II flippase MurJ [Bosea sp. (in: a-proteobacteria)]
AGAWINVGALFVLALRRGWTRPERKLPGLILIVAAAAACAGLAARLLAPPLRTALAGFAFEPKLLALGALSLLAAALYAVLALGGLKLTGLLRLLR